MVIEEFIHFSKSPLACISGAGKGRIPTFPLSTSFLLSCSVLRCECINILVLSHKEPAVESFL